MLRARLAVTAPWQGRGVVAVLLKDAMRRALRAADTAGIRSFAVHAKGDTAQRYYEQFGLLATPSDLVPSVCADEGFSADFEGRLGADINDNENVRRGQTAT